MPQNGPSWGPCLCQFSVLEWVNEWRLFGVVSKYFAQNQWTAVFPCYDFIRNRKCTQFNDYSLCLFPSQCESRQYLSHYAKLILYVFANIPQACLCSYFISHMPVCVFIYPAKPRPSSRITTSISPRDGEPKRQKARDSLPLQGQRLQTQLYSAGWHVCSATSC